MSKDTFILLLVIIFAYIYFKSIRENFELRRIRGDVDGVYIQDSNSVMGVPIGKFKSVDGVSIKTDSDIESDLQQIIPDGTTYNMTDDGILPKTYQYNISGVIPSGVNAATIFSTPSISTTKHIRRRQRRNYDLLQELTGETR